MDDVKEKVFANVKDMTDEKYAEMSNKIEQAFKNGATGHCDYYVVKGITPGPGL
jgi:hypothetical protein